MTYRRGRRSRRAYQLRLVRQVLMRYGYRGGDLNETTNLLDYGDVIVLLSRLTRPVDVSLCRVERGEILVDSRGEGSLQR